MSTASKEREAAARQVDAEAELAMAASSEAASRALRAGSQAPLFTLADGTGQRVALDDLLSAGPVVLHFFRGAWCSFGEQNLVEFAATYQEVVALGGSAVAIAPASNGTWSGSPLPMRELRDIDMKVARTYGLAFDLPASLRPRYEELGYRPPSTRRAADWLVPLPATYLLDRDGVVALAFIDVDYRNHFESEPLLNALKALQARHAARGRTMRLSRHRRRKAH